MKQYEKRELEKFIGSKQLFALHYESSDCEIQILDAESILKRVKDDFEKSGCKEDWGIVYCVTLEDYEAFLEY